MKDINGNYMIFNDWTLPWKNKQVYAKILYWFINKKKTLIGVCGSEAILNPGIYESPGIGQEKGSRLTAGFIIWPKSSYWRGADNFNADVY